MIGSRGKALANSETTFAGQWCGFLIGEGCFIHDRMSETLLEVRSDVLPWLLHSNPATGLSVTSMLRGSRRRDP